MRQGACVCGELKEKPFFCQFRSMEVVSNCSFRNVVTLNCSHLLQISIINHHPRVPEHSSGLKVRYK